MIEPKIGEIWVNKHDPGVSDSDGKNFQRMNSHGILIYNYDKEKDEVQHLYLIESYEEAGRKVYELKLDSIPRIGFYTTGQGTCSLKQLNDNWDKDVWGLYQGRSNF